MSSLARSVVRWWWAVIGAWLLAAFLLWSLAPPFDDVATFDNTAFLQEDAPAMVGGRLLEDGWPGDGFSDGIAFAFVRSDGELGDEDLDYARDVAAWLTSEDAPETVDVVTTHLEEPELTDVLVSEDGHAMFLLASLDVPAFTPPANATVEEFRVHLAGTDPPDGLEVHVTGGPAVAADQAAAIERSVARTHLITIALVALILLWVYRSPIAPLVPLITIGVAFVVSLSTVSLLARAGLDVSSLYETFSIVLVFGAGTDYCIFLLSRYHEELDLAEDRGYRAGTPLRRGTLVATVLVLGAVLGSSAATTIVGFSAQAVAEFGMFRTMGPAMALAIAITFLAALTLTPALMHVFGRWLFWPASGIRGSHPGDSLLIESKADRLGLDLAPAAATGDAGSSTGTTP
ncbi:MAG: MMPL family transporter [Actinobacteria bacterium]|nr:MMPL family transporter [Actinomycetota bacterium]